jgi:trk system potassium uptake protein
MHFSVIFRVLGVLLMIFSLTLLPPLAISLWYGDDHHHAFLIAFGITFITGLGTWLPVYRARHDLQTRDGFLITALFWSVLGLFGSLPFYISAELDASFTDSLFESISGLTTTGATVFTGLDFLPKSILYYRQQLQWLGGIGIIVIAVAILPMLGIGGMQLYRAETPGPVKDSKLTPRITETAKALFFMYLALTAMCALAYRLGGMSEFDAVCHAFSTVAIGGFSTHDASIGYFNSPAIMAICTFFMFFSGINFALHYFGWREHSLRQYFKDPECRFYSNWVLVGATITISYLYFTGTYGWFDSLMHGSFEFVSVLTTTGYGTADFSAWPTFLPFMLFLFAFMGGCGGSTAGGMKVMRVMLICKQGYREIKRLIHPSAIIPIKVGKKSVPDRVVEAVWGFFAVYIISFMVMFLMLLATGLDFVTSFSAVGASINNLGPGMGDVAAHYGNINDPAKWILCFAMLLGRLEVFTLLVLFTPMFWRR